MSLASRLPYDSPYAGGFPGIGSQPLPTDADALDYLSRMATADGAGVETGVAVAVDAFVRDSKALGVWDSIRASCVLAGARTLAGALVPLRDYGPELVDINSLESPSINNLGGSAGYWDAASRTAYSTATGAAGYPYFVFPVSVVVGKTYRFSGVLSGDFADINLFRFGNLNVTIAEDGSFDASLVANFADFKIYFESSLGPQAVTIDSLSIREVIAAPTNVADGFVEGDFSRTAGLTGDGTSYIDSGRSSDDDPAADCHLAVFSTSPPSGNIAMYVGGQVSNPYDIYRSAADMQFRNGGTQGASGLGLSTGLIASTRNAADSFSIRVSGTTTTAASVARTPNDVNMFVFARNAPGGTDFISDATIAFYSIGSSLSLEDLDTAVTNLINRLKFALLVGENPSGLDPDTIDYIVRGYEAGGSLE